MANPYFIDPWAGQAGSIAQGLRGLGATLGERREAKQQQELLAQGQEILRSGDPQAIAEFSIANPEIGQRIASGMQFASDATRQNMVESTRRILAGDDPEAVLTERLQTIQQQGGDPTETLSALQEYRDDPQAFMANAERVYAIYDPQGFAAYRKATAQPGREPLKMGTGDMAGYVFDPNTGRYSIDPNIKADLQAKAEEKAAEARRKSGEVDAKTRQGINKDVTALTKDTKFIYNAANDLEALQGRGSAAAKLAAVFKFMKALDPTSVVRESEQGQVYSAQGAAASLAGMLNNLVGEGKLTEAGFQDLVATSKQLAGSAVKASSEELNSYLDTYEDTLPETFKQKMLARIPVVEEEVAPALPPEDQAALDWANANPNDPRAAAIKSKLGVNDGL